MPYDITDPAAAHRLQLEGREKLTVAGVEDVERFDDQCIVLRTGAGVLVVSGESLHIGKLSLDGGELHANDEVAMLDLLGTYGFDFPYVPPSKPTKAEQKRIQIMTGGNENA